MKESRQLIGIVFGLVLSLGCVACDGGGQRSSVRSEIDLKQAALEAEQAEEDIARVRQLSSERAPASNETTKSPSRKKTKSISPAETVYVVQVGTFKVEGNADRLEKALKEKGLPAFKKKLEREGGVVLYTVRLEPTPTHSEATKFLASLKDAGQPGVILKVVR